MNPSVHADGEADLAILFPERRATIADTAVVMREYSFVEALQLSDHVAALTDAMTDVAMAGSFHDIDSLRSAFGHQADHVMELMAAACDQPLAWVNGLNASDGEQLMMLWWGVNTDFFLRRVLRSVQLRKLREIEAVAGPTSSPPSLPPDTTPAPYPGTRSVN